MPSPSNLQRDSEPDPATPPIPEAELREMLRRADGCTQGPWRLASVYGGFAYGILRKVPQEFAGQNLSLSVADLCAAAEWRTQFPRVVRRLLTVEAGRCPTCNTVSRWPSGECGYCTVSRWHEDEQASAAKWRERADEMQAHAKRLLEEKEQLQAMVRQLSGEKGGWP